MSSWVTEAELSVQALAKRSRGSKPNGLSAKTAGTREVGRRYVRERERGGGDCVLNALLRVQLYFTSLFFSSLSTSLTFDFLLLFLTRLSCESSRKGSLPSL